jgi:repressor LexA
VYGFIKNKMKSRFPLKEGIMKGLTAKQQNVYDFIIAMMEEKGYPPTVREIGDKFGIGPRAVFDHLKALQRKGKLMRTHSSPRALEISSREKSRGITLPIIGMIAAGKPILAEENYEGTMTIDRDFVPSEGSFLLKVRGDSMIGDHIMDGDYALVRPQATASNGEVVVAMWEGEATMKRFYRLDDGYRLEPSNPRYTPIFVPADTSLEIIGKVVGIIRRM